MAANFALTINPKKKTSSPKRLDMKYFFLFLYLFVDYSKSNSMTALHLKNGFCFRSNIDKTSSVG